MMKDSCDRLLTFLGALSIAALLSGCAREPAELSISKGQDALRNGHYADAANQLRKAARSRPTSATLQFNLGMAELGASRLTRAARAFRRAADLTPDENTDALEALARVRHLQGRREQAKAVYEQAFLRAGRRPRLLAAMAATELQGGRGELALTLLTEALAQDVEEPVALYNMACVQRDAFQDFSAAAAYFIRFLEVAPPSEADGRERAERALERLGEVLPATSARSEALILRSRQASDAAEAVSLAEQAVNEDPVSADALWNLATVLSRQARDEKRATTVYTRFAHRFPHDVRVARIPQEARTPGSQDARAAARDAEASSNWSAAVAAYRRALATDSRNAALWLRLSDAARAAGDSSLALEAATKAQEVKPDDPETLFRLGYLLHQRGQAQKAIEHYRRYLRVAPEGPQKESIRQWLRTTGG